MEGYLLNLCPILITVAIVCVDMIFECTTIVEYIGVDILLLYGWMMKIRKRQICALNGFGRIQFINLILIDKVFNIT